MRWIPLFVRHRAPFTALLAALAGCAMPPAAAVSPPMTERLPPALIQKVIRFGNDDYRSCYVAGRARNAGLKGFVEMRLVIGESGSVTEAVDIDRAPPGPMDWGAAKHEPSLPDPQVRACLVGQFKKLRFPPPGGVVTVTYPLVFEPGD